MTLPLLEVTVPAADAAARRLTTAARVRAVLRATTTADDTLIESIIDRASAMAAGYCKLARDPLGAVPAFGTETLRATWYAETDCRVRRGSRLVLPWRVPVTALASVVEAGATLTPDTDYKRGDKLLIGGRTRVVSDVDTRVDVGVTALYILTVDG